MNLSTGAVGKGQGSTTHYGHADSARDTANGVTFTDQLAWMDANPSKVGNGGIGGGLYNEIRAKAAAEKKNSGGGGGRGGWSGGSIGAGAGAYSPPDINFNPGGIDMGGDMADVWSNEDFIRGLAKERAEAYTDGTTTRQNSSIFNDIEQKIGNKGDWETIIGDNNTINNSLIGNDYSLNMGSINVANKQNQNLFA